MTTTTHVPYVLHRALHRGETPQVAVRCARRGAHEAPAGTTVSALAAWTSLLSRSATVRAANGSDVPLHCWLAVTQRSLVVVTTTPWQRDRRYNRRISLLRVRGASMVPAADGVVGARIELMDNHAIEVEVPLADGAGLMSFVQAVQRAVESLAGASS